MDLFRFTSVLKRMLDEDGRLQVVAMLWNMAYADGTINEFEENVVGGSPNCSAFHRGRA